MRIFKCMLLLSLVKGSDPTEYDLDLMKLLKTSVKSNKKSALSNRQKPSDPSRDHPTQFDRNLSLLLNTQIAYIKCTFGHKDTADPFCNVLHSLIKL